MTELQEAIAALNDGEVRQYVLNAMGYEERAEDQFTRFPQYWADRARMSWQAAEIRRERLRSAV